MSVPGLAAGANAGVNHAPLVLFDPDSNLRLQVRTQGRGPACCTCGKGAKRMPTLNSGHTNAACLLCGNRMTSIGITCCPA
jgi:hypothetical protein